MTYIVHDVEQLPTKVLHAIGTYQPGSIGVAGGYPSNTNQFVIKRGTNIHDLLDSGVVPDDLDDLDGELEIFTDSIVKTSQGRDDVHRYVAMGGGGYLDPLDREPDRVLADYIVGAVTTAHANDIYGVVLDTDEVSVDMAATEMRRSAVRDERRRSASRPDPDARQTGPA